VFYEIPEKQELVKLLLQRMKDNFPDEQLIGLIYLNTDDMQKAFQPIFNMLNKNFIITRVWGHFMRRGAVRLSHLHDAQFTGIYYLQIPSEDPAMLFIGDEPFAPVEGDFIVIPSMTDHSISEHRNDEVRLALGMDLEEKYKK